MIIRCLPAIILPHLSVLSAKGQTSGMSVLKTFHIKSSGGWDYIAVAPGTNELYVSHGTQVNILNKTTGDSIDVIPGTIGVHGIAFDTALGKGFISNGRLNNVFVFDLKTHKILDSIRTGRNPDAIFYESFLKKIITCNGGSKDASVIDPMSCKVITTIPLGGTPETAVSDGHGKMYIAIEDRNEVVRVNLKYLDVSNRYTLGGGEEPAGLAISSNGAFLYTGCGNGKLVVLFPDGAIGQTVVRVLPIGQHCDGVAFDNTTHKVFASCGDGTLHMMNTDSKKNPLSIAAVIPTKRGARTIAVDPQTHLIYLPTADFEQQTASKERPKMLPGTFQVLVVGQK